MTNSVIGFPRFTTLATFGTAGGGSWGTSYPVTNLNDLPLSQVARSSTAGTADTRFRATLADPQPVRLLGFVNHNSSLDGTFRIRVYADSAATDLLYDSGTGNEFWPPVYSLDDLEWEDPRWWTGKYSDAERAGYTATRPVWLPQVYAAQAIQVDVVDTTNTDGFFQCGLFEIAQGWTLSVGPRIGAEYGLLDRSIMIQAKGGGKYFDEQGDPRVFRGEIDYLPSTEAKAKAFEHLRQMKTVTPFLWVPDPDAAALPSTSEHPENLLRDCFLARNAALGLLSYVMPEDDRIPLNFEEVK